MQTDPSKGVPRCRILHIALKVKDLEKPTEFYKKVFGFSELGTKRSSDHLSRHMTDGELDLALMKYDHGTESAESKASGEGPCIHHFGIEVDDLEKYILEIKRCGSEIISAPGVLPIKFRTPDGSVAEIAPIGWFGKSAPR